MHKFNQMKFKPSLEAFYAILQILGPVWGLCLKAAKQKNAIMNCNHIIMYMLPFQQF